MWICFRYFLQIVLADFLISYRPSLPRQEISTLFIILVLVINSHNWWKKHGRERKRNGVLIIDVKIWECTVFLGSFGACHFLLCFVGGILPISPKVPALGTCCRASLRPRHEPTYRMSTSEPFGRELNGLL